MKLTNDGVYALAAALIPQYQHLLGLDHWVIRLAPGRGLEHHNMARTTWDTGNYLAQMQINTADYDWADDRMQGCAVLQQTLAHELVHLWFGEAKVYAQLGGLEQAGGFSEGAASAIDHLLEDVVDVIASRLTYNGVLKEVHASNNELVDKPGNDSGDVVVREQKANRVDCEPGQPRELACPDCDDTGVGPDTFASGDDIPGSQGVD